MASIRNDELAALHRDRERLTWLQTNFGAAISEMIFESGRPHSCRLRSAPRA